MDMTDLQCYIMYIYHIYSHIHHYQILNYF